MKNDRTRFEKKFKCFEEQASSPLSAQILEFCDSELFQETIQKSEVASSFNYCYEEQSSYSTNLSFPPDITKSPILVDNTTTTATTIIAPTSNNFSLSFKQGITESEISTHIDLPNVSHITNHQYPFSDQDQFDISMLQHQINPTRYNNTVNNSIFSYPQALSNDHIVHINDPTTLPSVCNETSLSSMPPYKFMPLINPLSPNYSVIDPSINSYLPLSTNCSGIFDENLLIGNDIQTHELEFQGDNSEIFSNDPLPHSYNSNDLQTLRNESQQLVIGGGSYTTPLVSEVTSLGLESFKVTNKLSSEERKEKIHKYLKKRNERNFHKKIKYACRKTLADSRPRVRGRFAKNNEFGETNRTNNNNEEDVDEDIRSFHGVVKEEEVFESLDIFSHIDGVNSFKNNFPVQSWI